MDIARELVPHGTESRAIVLSESQVSGGKTIMLRVSDQSTMTSFNVAHRVAMLRQAIVELFKLNELRFDTAMNAIGTLSWDQALEDGQLGDVDNTYTSSSDEELVAAARRRRASNEKISPADNT